LVERIPAAEPERGLGQRIPATWKGPGHERFVAGAPPQVLENERRKKADPPDGGKIKALEARIGQLAG